MIDEKQLLGDLLDFAFAAIKTDPKKMEQWIAKQTSDRLKVGGYHALAKAYEAEGKSDTVFAYYEKALKVPTKDSGRAVAFIDAAKYAEDLRDKKSWGAGHRFQPKSADLAYSLRKSDLEHAARLNGIAVNTEAYSAWSQTGELQDYYRAYVASLKKQLPLEAFHLPVVVGKLPYAATKDDLAKSIAEAEDVLRLAAEAAGNSSTPKKKNGGEKPASTAHCASDARSRKLEQFDKQDYKTEELAGYYRFTRAREDVRESYEHAADAVQRVRERLPRFHRRK